MKKVRGQGGEWKQGLGNGAPLTEWLQSLANGKYEQDRVLHEEKLISGASLYGREKGTRDKGNTCQTCCF